MPAAALSAWVLLCFLFLWLGQTALLFLVGHRPALAFPMRHGSSSAVVRWGMKGVLQLALALMLVFPVVLGEDLGAYYRARFLPVQWLALVKTVGMTLLVFGALLLITLLAGWVRLVIQYSSSRILKKVLRASLTPLPLALMEETVFRGLILEQLLRSFPGTSGGVWLAILLSAAIFSSVHFLREQKHVLLPALGLFGLGIALGILYVAAGHTIWLPVAVHGAGVWYIQITRPFTEYHGPAWIIGYRSYPICGALGLALMVVLTTWVVSESQKNPPVTATLGEPIPWSSVDHAGPR